MILLPLAAAKSAGRPARNPVIWADVPDPAIIRVDDTYYMSSTTMHMSPGLPIMKSTDLVNWELVGYAYDELGQNEALELENGENAYGAGFWASSLRYHRGVFYVSTFSSTTGKTHIYRTENIEEGPWEEISFSPSLHDHSLFFDDDGRVYMVYGGGDIRLVELKPDLSGIKPDGIDEVIIENASAVAGGKVMLPAEGSHLRKIDGRYYLMNITWPRGDMRTALVHRADSITGPYEGRVALRDKGVAQGGLIDTPQGHWYAFLFRDSGAVGRVPYLVPMRWEDGWPTLGVDGEAPDTLSIADTQPGLGNVVVSDDFGRSEGVLKRGLDHELLPLAWQWNHNPDGRFWSLAERPGWLRLKVGRIDKTVTQARNTLTQRSFGPMSSATTKLDVGGMNEGGHAGLIALQKIFGSVGVQVADGEKRIVMTSSKEDGSVSEERAPFAGDVVYLRIDCDFRELRDTAHFYYSHDGRSWTQIGQPFKMKYTLPHFMGYRFGLYHYSDKEVGGYADFDFYKVSESILRDDS